LIDRLADGSTIVSGEAKSLLYQSLKGEQKTRDRVDQLLDLLCETNVFRLGLEFQCQKCRRRSWYHPREFGERFSCTHCFAEQQVPRVDSLRWRYSTDGLFRSRNKVEGCLPVLLALHCFEVYL